jgi:small subunit ribosomal protein S16
VVRLRMKSLGRRHRPFFRICAIDSRRPRDGRAIEELGHYDPMSRNPETQTVLDVSRIRYWLSVGAQPSDKVQALLRKFKVTKPKPGEPWQVAEKPAPAPAPAAAGPQAPAAPATATATAPAPEPAGS